MHKIYLPIALLMSLILGSGLAAFTSNSAFAQNYGYQDDYYGQSSYGGGDNSYYSKYPMEDKTYECRTGPFEGFFTSSVEFCKNVKFDDRKDHKDRDNRTGTQGPPGPPGPPGPRGFNGTDGVNGTTERYTEVGNTTTGFAGTVTPLIAANAICDDGDFATGGSFVVVGNSTILSSQPLANETGWLAVAQVFGNPAQPGAPLGSVTADVICDDFPPLR